MKKITTIKYIFFAMVLLGTFSCKKYLDRTPDSSFTQNDYYLNGEQVQQALTGVYNAMGARTVSPGFSNPTTYYAKMDLFTEIGLERGLNGTIGSGAYDPNNGTVAEIWAAFYQVIQRANNLLFYMTKAQSSMSASEYNSVIAEAKVLRANAYWYLMTFYGDVPFFTAPPASQEELYNFTRTSKATIIDFLLTDLNSISNNLDWNPSAAGRVSRGVAKGVAARLAMLDKRYQVVADITDDIITNSGYGLNPVFQNLFRKAGQTTNVNREIMYYYPFGDLDAGSFSYIQLVQGSRNQGGQSSHFPTQFLVDLFECTDGKNIAESPLYNPARPNRNRDPRLRQTVIMPGDTSIVQGFTSMVYTFRDPFLASFNTTTSVITFPTATANQDSASIFGPRANGGGNLWKKYCQDRDINGTAGNLYRVGWIHMRFAEILLLNAEAHLEKGSPAATVATSINKVRVRAGMPVVDAITLGDINKLRQLVRREKTVELANEGLHLADMRRWDNGAYAQKVMPVQIVGQTNSNMKFTAGVGLEFIAPIAPIPTFDAIYNVPTTWPNATALRPDNTTFRLIRELRVFKPNQHILCPIPQGERDKVPALTQNPGW
jgi:starch-binding outer membrane protein, SusD/RagB family